MKNNRNYLLLLLLSLPFILFGQRTDKRPYVEIVMLPNHPDWIYGVGEEAVLDVYVTKGGVQLESGDIEFSCGAELMSVEKRDKIALKAGVAKIKIPSAKEPGFKSCDASTVVDGERFSNFIIIGFDPHLIRAATPLPDDFLSFWDGQKKRWSNLPLNSEIKYMPDKSTNKVDVYNISYAYNGLGGGIYGQARFFGVLAVPKAPGKYPAIYYLPGAGVRSYNPVMDMAEKGFITLTVGIHGIPVDMPDEVYRLLRLGALDKYPDFMNNNRELYYYNRVYEGCWKGVEFIFGLDKFDGKNLATWGGSQGGNLSLMVSALDSRVSCSVVQHPALTDMEGYLHGRAGGWPHLFRNYKGSATDDVVATMRYYDGVNFARQLKNSVIYTWGFNDKTCAPTTSYAVYNVTTAPKESVIVPNTGHWTYAEQRKKCYDFIKKQFGVK